MNTGRNNAVDENAKSHEADSGNASNPSPHNKNLEPGTHQLLNEKAEKYLRESGNIEDMPDAQDEEDAKTEEK